MRSSLDSVILIDALGQSLPLPQELWRRAIESAQHSGWTPSRTQAPPRAPGLSGALAEPKSWDGNYLTPQGQLVTHSDAAALAAALRKAQGLPAALDGLADFCTRGSFMICPLSPELRAYLEGGERPVRREQRKLKNIGPALLITLNPPRPRPLPTDGGD